MFEVGETTDRTTDPRAYYERLVKQWPEFAHLGDYQPSVAFLFRCHELVESGRKVIGTCSMPQVQGRHRNLFAWMIERLFGFEPVYLFTLDKDWWFAHSERDREILMFHEMKHTGQAVDAYGAPRFNRLSGEPIWTIVAHDVEEFTDTIRRYGQWTDEIREFVAAATAGSA